MVVIFFVAWVSFHYIEGPCRKRLYLFLARVWKIDSPAPSSSSTKLAETTETKMITETNTGVELAAPLIERVPTGRD